MIYILFVLRSMLYSELSSAGLRYSLQSKVNFSRNHSVLKEHVIFFVNDRTFLELDFLS